MATDVTICNSALIKLGAGQISALDNSSFESRLCSEQYEKIRQDLLYSHPWNFAIKRASWTANGNTPAWGFGQEFDLPVDFIRIIELSDSDIKYQIEGDKLVTDETELDLLYLYDETDPNKYSKGFIELLALKIAVELCHALVQSASLKQTLLAEYDQKLRDVRTFDAQEGTPRDVTDDLYINSRL
jgi:hypothetical protein